ncbi:uncharacterized protein si:ch211-145b13.6 [Danio rerio]|uniref:NAD(P)(+)--arginine ADP-ribosyltransferase n=1 Tax=Danio rerio TaxID=7955 RepID=A0A8M3APQ8_DANRE|nr:uncharacterized protein si:ch211-145b13.6 isoform X2 [Danio rerio]|eukprot:XP_009289877.1 uncharacterized protein si:ch211-145b13.6 isoform X2 [Danio rerio]
MERLPAYLLVLLSTIMVQITGKVIEMGMFPEAPDYSFYNCRKEMLQMVTKPGGLLQTEINNSTGFLSMWKNSRPCTKPIPGATSEHMTALQGYVADNAMSLIKNNCTTVYSGAEEEYKTEIGKKVRFKSFFPAKLKFTDATEDAEVSDDLGTVFSINSCSAIKLDSNGCNSEEMDLLISPTEVFTVENIETVHNSNDNYKHITLKHSEFQSKSDCSSLVSSMSKPDESKESSSSFLSSSLLNMMASLLVVYVFTLTM